MNGRIKNNHSMIHFLLKAMREEWEKYLLGKVELRDLQTRYKKQAKDPKRFGILDVVAPITPTRKAEASSVNKQEHDALLTAAQKLEIKLKRNVLWEMIHCLMMEIGSKGCGKVWNKKGPTNVHCPRNKATRNDKFEE